MGWGGGGGEGLLRREGLEKRRGTVLESAFGRKGSRGRGTAVTNGSTGLRLLY